MLTTSPSRAVTDITDGGFSSPSPAQDGAEIETSPLPPSCRPIWPFAPVATPISPPSRDEGSPRPSGPIAPSSAAVSVRQGASTSSSDDDTHDGGALKTGFVYDPVLGSDLGHQFQIRATLHDTVGVLATAFDNPIATLLLSTAGAAQSAVLHDTAPGQTIAITYIDDAQTIRAKPDTQFQI